MYLATLSLLAFSSSALAQDLGSTLEKVRATGVLTLGVREATVPFSYLDGNQRAVGYSMDLCTRVGEAVKERLGLGALTVKDVVVSTATRIPLLVNGTIDISCDAATNTLERQKQVSFALTHFLAAGRVMVKADSGIKSLEDLRGKTVVSTAGSTNLSLIMALNRERDLGLNILSGRDHGESFLMLQTGRAAAFIMDDVLSAGVAATAHDAKNYVFTDEFLSLEPYGLIIRRNDSQFEDVVNDTLRNIYTSGEINKIYEKWFSSPIPPNNITLNLPMSDAFKKQVANPIASANPADYK